VTSPPYSLGEAVTCWAGCPPLPLMAIRGMFVLRGDLSPLYMYMYVV